MMLPWILELFSTNQRKVSIDFHATQTNTGDSNSFNTSYHSIAAPEANKIFVVCILANGTSSLDFAANMPRATFKLNGTTVLNNVALTLAHKRAPNANLSAIYYYDLSGVSVNEAGVHIGFNENATRSGVSFLSLRGVESVAPQSTAEGSVSASSVSASVVTQAGGATIGVAHRQVNTTGTLNAPFSFTVYNTNPESAVRWLAGFEENTPTEASREYTASWASSGGANIVLAHWR